MFVSDFRKDHQQLQADVSELIAGLGPDRGTVAEQLASAGITGLRSNAQQCAVARYLNAVVGGDSRVKRILVSASHVRLIRPGWRPAVTMELPAAVAAFVRAFDSGSFPRLVDSGRPPVEHQAGPQG